MTEKEKARKFSDEVNNAVKAFMLKITVICAEYRVDPTELLMECGKDIIVHGAVMDYKFGKKYKEGEES